MNFTSRFLAPRRGLVSIILSAASFACFSLFLYFALIDMVLTVLVPITMSASSYLSEISLFMILVSSVLFGLFNWRLPIITSFVAWISFYFEYLTPQRLYYWAAYLFSSFHPGHLFDIPHTPVYLRPDILAIGFFLLGSLIFLARTIYSRNGAFLRPLARFLIVPALMLFIFEVIIGSISIDHLFTPVILGFRVNFVPSFVWQIRNFQVLGLSFFVMMLCSLVLLSTSDSERVQIERRGS
jgi:hypothetical protein